MIRRPPRSTQSRSSAASDVYKRQLPKEIKNVSHFYWMSFSSFEYALEKYPEIKNRNHACGLGRTFEEINTVIPGKVYPYLKYQDWLEKINQAK